MDKKVVFSAKLEHDVIKTVIPILKKKIKDVDLILHDPTKDIREQNEAYEELVEYEEMFWKFWIWDIEKLKKK